jgi:hypothetical protein
MTISLDDLITELRTHIGIDEDDVDDEEAKLLLNRAYWSMLNKFPFRELQVTATFTLTAGTSLYVMPSPFEALRQISYEDDVSMKHTIIERMTEFEYENTFVNSADAYGAPLKYYREKNAVKLYPTPDKNYSAVLKYLTTLDDLDDPTDVPGVPRNWHEILLIGGIWRGFYRVGDIVRGERMKKLDSTMINEAVPTESKEEKDSHTAGVEVLLNEYDAR